MAFVVVSTLPAPMLSLISALCLVQLTGIVSGTMQDREGKTATIITHVPVVAS